MEKATSLFFGVFLSVLTVAGFLLPRKHFLKLMNVDKTHSMIRIPLAMALLSGSLPVTKMKITREILLGTGIFYIVMGTAGLADKRVAGLLPSGLTKFDIVYHYATGAAAIWLGARSGRMMKP